MLLYYYLDILLLSILIIVQLKAMLFLRVMHMNFIWRTNHIYSFYSKIDHLIRVHSLMGGWNRYIG